MSLEWLRRNDPVLDAHLRQYLFTDRLDPGGRGGRGDGGGRRRRPAGDGEPRHRQPARRGRAMNHLLRELAPVTDAAWARDRGRGAPRPHATSSPPAGWSTSSARRAGTTRALGLGRVTDAQEGPAEGVESRVRLVQPLIELRTPFTLARDEIDAVERGAPDADWDPVVHAARRAALAEDRLVFGGFPARRRPRPGRDLAPRADHDQRRLRPLPQPRREGRRDPEAGRRDRPLRDRPRAALLHRA